MLGAVKIAVATLASATAVALAVAALELGSTLQIVAMALGILAVSLVDPVRFWATDEFPPQTRLGSLLLRTPRQPR